MEEDLTTKPEEYADAPQWQKDAWDSETGKAIRSSGWVAPSACAAGICKTGDDHNDACNGAGGAYAQGNWGTPLLSLPALSVRRGGIKFLRYPVYTSVRKAGWHEFYVQVRVHMQEESVEIGPFTRRKYAVSAQEVIMDTARSINELVSADREKNL